LCSEKLSFKRAKRLGAAALVLFASYFALEIPFVPYLLRPATTFFAYSYAVQALFTVPLMAILAFNVWNYDGSPKRLTMWKWTGIAFVGFIVALWANVAMHWFDMISLSGLAFLLTGIISSGFLDSAILMSLAVVSSIIAATYFTKQNRLQAMRWVGLFFTAVGLHYIILHRLFVLCECSKFCAAS